MALEPLITEQPVTHKRYLLLKYHDAKARDQQHLAGVWRANIATLPVGDVLPLTFPFAARLASAGYTERAYLDGATVDELMRTVGMSQFDAEAVLAAFAALPAIP